VTGVLAIRRNRSGTDRLDAKVLPFQFYQIVHFQIRSYR
jgi:hypothetical protein